MEIAVNSSQREIVEIITAVVKSWRDVFDVKRRQRGIALMQLAILATMAGALPDAGFRSLVHRSGFRAGQLPRLPLENGNKLVRPHITRVFSFLGFGELALG